MNLRLDLPENRGKAVTQAQLQNYMTFRADFPKPVGEDAHVRHIFRFYVARTLAKSGYTDILIRPVVQVGTHTLDVDVAAAEGNHHVLALCEPAAVTAETTAKLDVLADAEDTEVIVLYSRHAHPGDVPQRFAQQVASRAFRLMSVVPPPFDDVFEYDIWMFELTFREVAG